MRALRTLPAVAAAGLLLAACTGTGTSTEESDPPRETLTPAAAASPSPSGVPTSSPTPSPTPSVTRDQVVAELAGTQFIGGEDNAECLVDALITEVDLQSLMEGTFSPTDDQAAFVAARAADCIPLDGTLEAVGLQGEEIECVKEQYDRDELVDFYLALFSGEISEEGNAGGKIQQAIADCAGA